MMGKLKLEEKEILLSEQINNLNDKDMYIRQVYGLKICLSGLQWKECLLNYKKNKL